MRVMKVTLVLLVFAIFVGAMAATSTAATPSVGSSSKIPSLTGMNSGLGKKNTTQPKMALDNSAASQEVKQKSQGIMKGVMSNIAQGMSEPSTHIYVPSIGSTRATLGQTGKQPALSPGIGHVPSVPSSNPNISTI
ncbi:MAG TPA: hypothetical protein VK436_16580 [Methanocella sp.]|nr:hypothetical protein [Methanocella sp.]